MADSNVDGPRAAYPACAVNYARDGASLLLAFAKMVGQACYELLWRKANNAPGDQERHAVKRGFQFTRGGTPAHLLGRVSLRSLPWLSLCPPIDFSLHAFTHYIYEPCVTSLTHDEWIRLARLPFLQFRQLP